MCSCARRSVKLWRYVKEIQHHRRHLNLGARWKWILRWRLRPLQFQGKGPRLKLNRNVDITSAELNPSEKRNISWEFTELEVDWPITQAVSWSVYGLGICSRNETYGQTKINHIVMVSFDVILGGEVETKLDSYNVIQCSGMLWAMFISEVSVRIPLFGTFELLHHVCLSVHPSVRTEELIPQWADFNEIWHLNIFKKSVKNSSWGKMRQKWWILDAKVCVHL